MKRLDQLYYPKMYFQKRKKNNIIVQSIHSLLRSEFKLKTKINNNRYPCLVFLYQSALIHHYVFRQKRKKLKSNSKSDPTYSAAAAHVLPSPTTCHIQTVRYSLRNLINEISLVKTETHAASTMKYFTPQVGTYRDNGTAELRNQ